MHRILLVEDNPADVHLLRIALTDAGVQADLTVFEDGAEAIAYVEQRCASGDMPQMDLAIIDLNVPKRGGLEILSSMRACRQFASVPALVLTSSLSDRDRDSALQFPQARFIVKPSNLDDFLKIGVEVRDTLTPA
jgi:CheY-like chemotaxis protein